MGLEQWQVEMSRLPKYTEEKRKGNIGEAFVQYVLSSFCLVHKIDGNQDVGNDFICELIKGKYPANILFYVQVKYWDREPTDKDVEKTFEYWKGSPIPVYLFWLNTKDELPCLNTNNLTPKEKIEPLKYKRYTLITHGNRQVEKHKFESFSKGVFIRDLMVDYARCLYKRGMATVIKKEDFTEVDKAGVPLGDYYLLIDDVIPDEYKHEFIHNSWTNLLATAKSLAVHSPNDGSILQLALKHVQLASEMIDMADPHIQGSKSMIQKLEQEIQSNLKKCSGQSA